MAELDAKVAELLGWHIKNSRNSNWPALYDGEGKWYGDLDRNMVSMPLQEVLACVVNFGGTVPGYSTDLNAAWGLLDKLGLDAAPLVDLARFEGWTAARFAQEICEKLVALNVKA
jgi:hypothetical protein